MLRGISHLLELRWGEHRGSDSAPADIFLFVSPKETEALCSRGTVTESSSVIGAPDGLKDFT